MKSKLCHRLTACMMTLLVFFLLAPSVANAYDKLSTIRHYVVVLYQMTPQPVYVNHNYSIIYNYANNNTQWVLTKQTQGGSIEKANTSPPVYPFPMTISNAWVEYKVQGSSSSTNLSFVLDNGPFIVPSGDKPWGYKRDTGLTMNINSLTYLFTPKIYLYAPGTANSTYTLTGQNLVFSK